MPYARLVTLALAAGLLALPALLAAARPAGAQGLVPLAPAAGQAGQAGQDLIALVELFQTTWNTHDADAVLAFFTEDAVVSDNGRFEGKDAIRRWLQARFDERWRIAVGTDYRVAGNTVHWTARLSTFTSRALGALPLEATIQAAIRDGKIAAYTSTVEPAALSRHRLSIRNALATRTARLEAQSGDPLPAPATAVSPARPGVPASQPPPAPGDRGTPSPAGWAGALGVMLLVLVLAMARRPQRW